MGDDGVVSEGSVFVGTLLGCPTENVESEVWVRLGGEGVVNIGWSETGFEVVDPGFKLFFEWCFRRGCCWDGGIE